MGFGVRLTAAACGGLLEFTGLGRVTGLPVCGVGCVACSPGRDLVSEAAATRPALPDTVDVEVAAIPTRLAAVCINGTPPVRVGKAAAVSIAGANLFFPPANFLLSAWPAATAIKTKNKIIPVATSTRRANSAISSVIAASLLHAVA